MTATQCNINSRAQGGSHQTRTPLFRRVSDSDRRQYLSNELSSRNPIARSVFRVRIAFEMWIYRRPRLFGFLSETRSYLHRTRAVLGSPDYSQGLAGGLLFRQREGGFSLNHQTLGGIEDMQRISAQRPELSLLDFDLLMQGWNLGDEWGLRKSRTDTERQSAD
jgi:hypothetical protein